MSLTPPERVLGPIRAAVAAGMLDALGDGSLLDRFVVQRDEAAFGALLGRHAAMVLGVCRRALADEERHGYAIMQETAARTDGLLKLDPATLYRALRRMVKAGLVADSARRRKDPAADDERRRYYRVTPLGRLVALRETERLEDLVRSARSTRLLRQA